MTDMKTVATDIENVVKQVQTFEPFVAGILEAIPGLNTPVAMIQPWVPGLLTLAVQGLDAIATQNGGNFGAALTEWMQHNMAGQPNSPILSGGVLTPATGEHG